MLLCTCMFRFVRDFRFFLHVDLFHDVDFNFFLLLFNNNYGKRKKKFGKILRNIHRAVRCIFPTSVLSIIVGDNFEENKCRSSNCVTHLKRDELFLEKIYIFSQTFFIHLSLDISSLLSSFPEFLLSTLKDFSFVLEIHMCRLLLPNSWRVCKRILFYLGFSSSDIYIFFSRSLSSHLLPRILFKLGDFLLLPFNDPQSRF